MRGGWSLGTRLGLEVGPPPPTEAVRLALSSCVAGTHSESPGSLSLSVSSGRGHELLETMSVSVQVPRLASPVRQLQFKGLSPLFPLS